MSSLRQLQEQFLSYIHQQAEGIEEQIVDAPQISIQRRIDIYRNGYYLRLTEILEREFISLKNLMGNEDYKALCREYIDTYPSAHFSLRTFGRHMLQFLNSRPNSDPLHCELVEFEWLFGQVLNAPDGTHLTVDEMMAIPPEAWATLRMTLHPSLAFITLNYNSPLIWQALFENDPEKHPVPALEKAEKPVKWIIWRFHQRAHYQDLSPEKELMLKGIQENQTFLEICEALCTLMDPEHVAQFAGSTLREWVSLGLIASAEYQNPETT